MATNRLDMLKQMVASDDTNTFARYGLAMEYANTGEPAVAIQEFRRLLEQDKTYVAAYFHGGQALEKLGQVEEARGMYEEGIRAAAAKGDAHTKAELEAALDALPL